MALLISAMQHALLTNLWITIICATLHVLSQHLINIKVPAMLFVLLPLLLATLILAMQNVPLQHL